MVCLRFFRNGRASCSGFAPYETKMEGNTCLALRIGWKLDGTRGMTTQRTYTQRVGMGGLLPSCSRVSGASQVGYSWQRPTSRQRISSRQRNWARPQAHLCPHGMAVCAQLARPVYQVACHLDAVVLMADDTYVPEHLAAAPCNRHRRSHHPFVPGQSRQGVTHV